MNKTTQAQTTALRTLDEIWTQARLDGKNEAPLTQAQADLVAAILTPYHREWRSKDKGARVHLRRGQRTEGTYPLPADRRQGVGRVAASQARKLAGTGYRRAVDDITPQEYREAERQALAMLAALVREDDEAGINILRGGIGLPTLLAAFNLFFAVLAESGQDPADWIADRQRQWLEQEAQGDDG